MKLPNPYVGIAPPLGIAVPAPDQLINKLCSETEAQKGFPYPPEAPVFWIKYGSAVCWNEVCAQVMAYEGLRRLGSEQVRAPGVFYAQMNYPDTYIVMEYIPGKPASQCIDEAQGDAAKETLLRQSMELAISELHRIPMDPDTRPAAVSGARIQYRSVFEGDAACRHYENAQQLEDHFNAFLRVAQSRRRVQHVVRDLAREPLVFCPSDLSEDKFIIDNESGRVAVVGFAQTSTLPASFAKLAVSDYRLDANVSVAEGIDNTRAIRAVAILRVPCQAAYVTTGKRAPGGDKDTQTCYNELYSDSPEADERSPPGGWTLQSTDDGGVIWTPTGEEPGTTC